MDVGKVESQVVDLFEDEHRSVIADGVGDRVVVHVEPKLGVEDVAEVAVLAGVYGEEDRPHDGVIALDALIGVAALLAEELRRDRTDRNADDCQVISSP